MTDRDIVERLREPMDGWTGDAHCVSAEVAEEAAAEIERLHALLSEIDRRVMFESVGMGNTFAESVECYTLHGGRCPTVEEAYSGALRCDAHR